jgi:prepilin peptidase CpaA
MPFTPLETPAVAGLVFLPFATAIGLWVAWSDLARMKIPNIAVMLLVAIYLVVGPFVLPLADWGWRWTHLLVVFGAGFAMNQFGMLGAGDVKFAAAAAPFVAARDAALLLVPLSLLMLAGLLVHRILRRIPAVRSATPGWESWTNRKFPAGLALGPSLAFYLAACAAWGS